MNLDKFAVDYAADPRTCRLLGHRIVFAPGRKPVAPGSILSPADRSRIAEKSAESALRRLGESKKQGPGSDIDTQNLPLGGQ